MSGSLDLFTPPEPGSVGFADIAFHPDACYAICRVVKASRLCQMWLVEPLQNMPGNSDWGAASRRRVNVWIPLAGNNAHKARSDYRNLVKDFLYDQRQRLEVFHQDVRGIAAKTWRK
jgi:hypothetical protein